MMKTPDIVGPRLAGYGGGMKAYHIYLLRHGMTQA
jgi:hypothetical protein